MTDELKVTVFVAIFNVRKHECDLVPTFDFKSSNSPTVEHL